MLQIEIHHPQGRRQLLQAPADSVIGKSVQSEVRLDSWRVAKSHARLLTTPSGVLLEDMGSFAGTWVNGSRVNVQYGPLKPDDEVTIGPFKLKVAPLGHTLEGMVQAAHPESRSSTAAVRNQLATERLQASREAARKAQSAILQETQHASSTEAATTPVTSASRIQYPMVIAPDAAYKELEFDWRRSIHAELLKTMDLRRQDVASMSDQQLRHETGRLIKEIIDKFQDDIPEQLDRRVLAKQVLDEAVGLGLLEELLDDQSVSEIMVNRFDEIYVERSGRLVRHPMTFTGNRAVMGVIERIVAPLGRRIDESSPMVDARLKDGSRVNAVIPPLALKGPCLTIRKFAKRKLTADDLVAFGAVSEDMANFLRISVENRRNIIVSGGTGSGKTTLLNILSNFIPHHERVITVEDAAELKLHHDHLISLESRPANVEGRGAISIRELVRNTLRMRPDRIVVGECRGAEALDMLQAMNTGHEGSLTTLHANTPRDALARLETMVLMAGMDLPLTAIREQITSAVHLIVQQTRFACGTRMVTHIVEVTGMESGRIQIQELFKFVNLGYARESVDATHMKVQGYFTACDTVPHFYEELRAIGVPVDVGVFRATEASGAV